MAPQTESQIPTEQVAPPTVADAAATETTEAKAEKPARKYKTKSLTRKILLVEKYKEGITDVEQLTDIMVAHIESGALKERKNLRKLEANRAMWVQQVKWYLHQAKREGLIEGEVSTRQPRKPRKPKEAAAPGTTETAPTADALPAEVASPQTEPSEPLASAAGSEPVQEEDLGTL